MHYKHKRANVSHRYANWGGSEKRAEVTAGHKSYNTMVNNQNCSTCHAASRSLYRHTLLQPVTTVTYSFTHYKAKLT